MLVAINLLPSKDKLRQRQIKLNARILTLCFLALAAFIASAIILFSYLANLKLEINSINQEIKTTQTRLAEYQETEKKAQTINDRINNVKTLGSKGIDWNQFIDYFNALVPQGVQITTIKASSASPSKLEVGGNASSRREALKFFEKLKADPGFTNTTLLTLTASTNPESSQAVQLSISADIRQPAEAKAAQ